MTEKVGAAFAVPKARIAGFLYLIVIAVGVFAEFFVRGKVFVAGDAIRTAHNILTSESLFRWGFAAYLADTSFYLVVSVIIYELLKPAGKSLSLLALVFSIVGSALGAVAAFYHFVPLVILAGTSGLNAMGTGQLQALAFLSLRLHAIVYLICLVFFGFHMMVVGYLMAVSTFLPRSLGVLQSIGGLCYIINSFANFLSPPLAALLYRFILAPGILSEVLLALWLLLAGVNIARWQERARIATTR